MKETSPLQQGDDDKNRALVNYLIGIEMSYATFVYDCCAYCLANKLVFYQMIFRRHSATLVEILECLAEIANSGFPSMSAVSELADGSSQLESLKSMGEIENIINITFRANEVILAFLDTKKDMFSLNAAVEALRFDMDRAHKKIRMELARMITG